MAKKRAHVKISNALRDQLQKRAQEDGYGPRGQSRWVIEAVTALLEDDPTMRRLGQGDALDVPMKGTVLVAIPPETLQAISTVLRQQRVREPDSDQSVSILLRTAMRYRLSNSDRFLDKRVSLLLSSKTQDGPVAASRAPRRQLLLRRRSA